MAPLESRPRLQSPDSPSNISPDASPEVTQEGRRALELLRVVGLTWLILYHSVLVGNPGNSGALGKLLGLVGHAGYMGTDLLLALAGFLAVGSYQRSRGAGPWLLRRAIRVFPALALFLGAYLYVIPSLVGAFGGAPESLPNYADLGRARSVQWMMWTMVANYLMVWGQRLGAALEPLLTLSLFAQLSVLAAFLLPSRRRVLWGAGLVALAGVVLRLYWLRADPYTPYSFPLSRGDGFLLGLVFGVLSRWETTRDRLLALRKRLVLVSSITMLCVVAAMRGEWLASPWMKLFGYPAVALWSASLVLWLANLSALPRPLHALARLGQSTYCAYFVKLPLCFLVLQVFPQTKHLPFPVAALACVGATWLLAWVWHTTMEGPLVRLGYRLLGR